MPKMLDTQDASRHVVPTGVSWARYEQTIEEIRNNSARVSFLDGAMEIIDIDPVRGMKRFAPLAHRPPDLWIEVDLLSPSVPREPIHARLGVPEVWRHSGGRLFARLLTIDGFYVDSPTSRAFPFLPLPDFAAFIHQMLERDETQVLTEFREWVRMLAK